MESEAPWPETVPLVTLEKWLPRIFPEGISNRTYLTRQMAAKTLFVMFYTGAVEGSERWVRPDQITKMTDEQAGKTELKERIKWSNRSLIAGELTHISGRWYAANTREPIRDETLRSGLVAVGAVVEKQNIPTTSSKPRYAIAKHFAELVEGIRNSPEAAEPRIAEWQSIYLSAGALGRIALVRSGAVQTKGSERVRITFPNGETRLMQPGPSTVITKAVIEKFAPRFLKEPGVVLVSESAEKVVQRDETLARAVGLKLDFAKNLPDLILADVHRESTKVLFVEVVATDGAVTEARKRSLLEKAREAGFAEESIWFLTAFLDRTSPAFRKLVGEIAWGTLVWFASEPEKLLIFAEGQATELDRMQEMGDK